MVTSEPENASREYKDSLFTALFSDENEARKLYNAVTGSTYNADTVIVIKTLSDIFYRLQKNDLAFLIEDRLIIFFEHQSTLNPGIPVRIFLYAAGVYKAVLEDMSLYSKKKQLIPRPEFYMLYNGPDKLPDKIDLKLSDLFKQVPGHEQIDLELTVHVLNINHGHNKDIMAECETLRGYALFGAKVREYLGTVKGLDRGERKAALGKAIRKTIEYCIGHDVLKEFLEKHVGEVINMLTMEFDISVAEQVWKEEAREEGREEGIQEGMQKGLQEGKREVAIKLLKRGLDVELVAESTGLPADSVQSLKESL